MTSKEHLAAFAILSTVGLLALALPWLERTDTRVRRTFLLVFCVLKCIYFYYRVAFTLPAPTLAWTTLYAYVFFLLEVQVTVALYRWLSGLMHHRERSSEADAHADWYRARDALPSVDILIPTYNESWSVLEKTFVGALGQTYGKCRVWVLDDGRRDWLRSASAELGVRYLTREGNTHAKAGNLNAGLAQIREISPGAEFVAVLDADFIARPLFVERALALMHDPKVGIVQTPQYHHNPDPFQRKFRATKGWPDTQRFAFSCFLPARDAEGGAYCCGTSFLARTAALDTIGGFPTESVTEDVLTSVKMGMNGYKTVFLGELLSTGLAAEGLHEYLTQRGRWCLGTVQLGLWLFDLNKEERSVWNRFWGSEGCFRWGYTSLFRLVFLCVPPIYWFTGVAPFQATTSDVLLYAVPVMILQRVFIAWVSQGTQLPLIYEASSLLANFVVVRALFKGVFDRRSHTFAVTDKGVKSDALVIHWGTLRWFFGYAALLLGSVVYAYCATDGAARSDGFQGVTLLWSLINLALVALAAAPCFEEPRRRAEERYPTRESVQLRSSAGGHERVLTGRLQDISVSGCLVVSMEELALGERLRVELVGLPPFEATVSRVGQSGQRGLAFRLSAVERRLLVRRIFCTTAYVVPDEIGDAGLTILAVAKTAFR